MYVLGHPREFIARTLKSFRANQGLLLAGAVAYYTLLSVVPLATGDEKGVRPLFGPGLAPLQPMFVNLRKQWSDLGKGRPGHRFQDRHERRKGRRAGFWKPLYLIGGAALCLFGIVLLPAPGPGFVFVFFGGAMLAEESLLAARTLDWLELKVRALLSRIRHGLRPGSPRRTSRSSR